VPSVEQFPSGEAESISFDLQGFSGITDYGVAQTGAIKNVDLNFATLYGTGPDWVTCQIVANKWNFAALPSGSVITSYEVKFYDATSSPGADDITMYTQLVACSDIFAGIGYDFTAISSAQTFPMGGTGANYSATIPVSKAESTFIQTGLIDPLFALAFYLSSKGETTIFLDALSLTLNYEKTSDSTFRNRGGSRERLLWGVR